MANTRFSVACPTCDAPVPIKNDSLVGKKVECPTCKAPFVVPPNPATAAADTSPETPAAKSKAKTKPKKVPAAPGAKKPANTKLLAGLGIGAAAILVLGVAGFFLLSGGDEPKKPTPPARNYAQNTTPTSDRGGDADPAPGGAAETTPGAETPPPEKPPEPVKPPQPPSPVRELTNLLPGDAKGVYRVNHDTLSLQATPLFNAIFDTKVRDLFRQSLTFGSDQLATSMHCVVGPERSAFVLLRSKGEFDTESMAKEMKLAAAKKAKGGEYFPLKANPFVEALAGAFSKRVLAQAVGIDLPVPPPSDAATEYALSILDPRTVAIGESKAVASYLDGLKDNGFPAFKSEPPPAAPPPKPAVEGEPAPAEEVKPAAPPKPLDLSKLTTATPTYLTIDPALKRLLNLLDDEAKTPPCVVYAEAVDQALLAPLAQAAAGAVPEPARATTEPLAAMLKNAVRVGATLDQFARDHARGQLLLEFATEDEAKKAAADAVAPLFVKYLPAWDYFLSTQTRVVGNAAGAAANIQPAGGSTGFGGPPGFGGVPPGAGGPSGGNRGYGQGGQSAPSGSGSSGGQGYGRGQGGQSAPSGRGGSSPDGGGYGGMPGGPMAPGGFGGPTPPPQDDPLDPKGPNQGVVELAQSDRVLSARFALNWPEKDYATLIQPEITRAGTQFRGRMGVFGGGVDWHDAAQAPRALAAEKKPYPAGTAARQAGSSRFGLPYPPEERASLFVELLPYLGQEPLRRAIDDKNRAWYDKENLAAAEAWVPELLAPYYPQESWRATNPLAPGRSLGGTNFVALSGVGLESARFDPTDPEQAKKVGITGYGWSSKPEDITDGLSNTIYLAQVAPGGGRPWIAGGGATVLGVANDELAMQPFVHRAPGGTRGAYVVMADGSVRFIKEGASPKLFQALATRAGGESLADLDKASEVVPPKPGKAELKGDARASR